MDLSQDQAGEGHMMMMLLFFSRACQCEGNYEHRNASFIHFILFTLRARSRCVNGFDKIPTFVLEQQQRQ